MPNGALREERGESDLQKRGQSIVDRHRVPREEAETLRALTRNPQSVSLNGAFPQEAPSSSRPDDHGQQHRHEGNQRLADGGLRFLMPVVCLSGANYYFPSVLMIVAGQPVQLGEANAPSRIQRKKLDDNPPLALEA